MLALSKKILDFLMIIQLITICFIVLYTVFKIFYFFVEINKCLSIRLIGLVILFFLVKYILKSSSNFKDIVIQYITIYSAYFIAYKFVGIFETIIYIFKKPVGESVHKISTLFIENTNENLVQFDKTLLIGINGVIFAMILLIYFKNEYIITRLNDRMGKVFKTELCINKYKKNSYNSVYIVTVIAASLKYLFEDVKFLPYFDWLDMLVPLFIVCTAVFFCIDRIKKEF